MDSQNFFKKTDELKTLRNELFVKYGNRLIPKSIENTKEGSYIVNFSYNRPFNVIDEKNKKIFVRTLHLDDIYIEEITSLKNISLPIQEINHKISNELDNLHKNIEKKVLGSKDLILKLLFMPNFSSSLSRFSRIINRLIEKDIVTNEYKKELLKEHNNYKSYFQVLINSKFIEFKEGNYYCSSRLKKIFKESNNRENPQKITHDEVMYYVISENYSYIVNELALTAVQSSIDLLITFFYLSKYQDLVDVNLSVKGLYNVHTQVFKRKESKSHFEDRVTELKNYNLINDSLCLS